MKKSNLLWFAAGCVLMFFICIAIGTYQAKCREKCQENDFNKVMFAYFELDDALFTSALNNFKNKNYQDALYDMKKNDEIRKSIHLDVPDYRVKASEAVTCLTELVDLNQKIKANPNDYRLYLKRANLQNKPGIAMFEDAPQTFCSDFQSALEDYSKVIELKPDLKEVYEKRADATGYSMDGIRYNHSERAKYEKIFKDNYKNMIADYQKAIELNGKSPELQNKLAGAYVSDEQYENAIKIFEELKSEDTTAYFGLALSYSGLNRPQETIENIDLFIANMQNCKPTACEPHKWAMKDLYRMRANANFKLHRYMDSFKDYFKKFD